MKKKRKETFVSLFLGDAFDDDITEEILDDTTFNELNDRTKDLTDELSEIIEKEEQPIIEEVTEEVVIESSFPKINKFGTVVPHKVEIEQ